MSDLITTYLLGVCITSCLVVVWFQTNLPLHIWSILGLMNKVSDVKDDSDCNCNDNDIWGMLEIDEIPQTWEDWETLVYTQNKFFSELLSCPLCLGTWFAAITAIILILVNGLTWWFLPAAIFSWPLFAFLLHHTLTSGWAKKEIDT